MARAGAMAISITGPPPRWQREVARGHGAAAVAEEMEEAARG